MGLWCLNEGLILVAIPEEIVLPVDRVAIAAILFR